MSISVTCPNCLKRFQVSDKYAGKSGPCPNCKKTLKVPDKSEEVVVHAPEAFEHGGRGIDGKLALKPIDREETKITPLLIVSIAVAVVLVFVAAFVGRGLFQANIIFSAVGLLLISPPTALAAYSFLRNDDLEPYRGTALYVRSLICGVAYVVLWGVFIYALHHFDNPELLTWAMLVAPVLVAGTAVAYFALDLEPGNAFCHYAFYLFVTNLLYWVVWYKWIWQK